MMATLAELDRLNRERHAPLYASAREIERLLTGAIEQDTCHKPRLIKLRGYVRSAMRGSWIELSGFLAEYGETFSHEIAAAHRAARVEDEAEVRPAHFTLGVAA